MFRGLWGGDLLMGCGWGRGLSAGGYHGLGRGPITHSNTFANVVGESRSGFFTVHIAHDLSRNVKGYAVFTPKGVGGDIHLLLLVKETQIFHCHFKDCQLSLILKIVRPGERRKKKKEKRISIEMNNCTKVIINNKISSCVFFVVTGNWNTKIFILVLVVIFSGILFFLNSGF